MARSSEFTRIMELVLKGELVYIKDTGIKVLVTDFNYHRGSKKNFIVQIRFEDVPNKKSIEQCDSFHVRCNRGLSTLGGVNHVSSANIDAHIAFNQLSDIPYESKAAKTLYKKQK